MSRHADAAAALLATRKGTAPREPTLPDAMRPQTEEEAYLIQMGVSAVLGPVGAWKVGSPGPAATHFTCAPIPTAVVWEAPTTVVGSDRVVEAEIAVRLGRDLPPRATPYSVEEVRAAVASVHPALEVLETRFVSAEGAGALSALADSLSNFGLVVGPAIDGWEAVDLAAETVELLVDGQVVKRGAGNPGGEMLRLVGWLGAIGAAWSGGLRAGQVVTTGSWTGKDPAPPNVDVTARFARCGAVSMRFAPEKTP